MIVAAHEQYYCVLFQPQMKIDIGFFSILLGRSLGAFLFRALCAIGTH